MIGITQGRGIVRLLVTVDLSVVLASVGDCSVMLVAVKSGASDPLGVCSAGLLVVLSVGVEVATVLLSGGGGRLVSHSTACGGL